MPDVVSDSPHFHGNPKLGQVAFLAVDLGRVLDEALGGAARIHYRLMLAVALQRKAFDGLAGLGDAVDDSARPAGLDPDDHDRGDVGVTSGADQRAEMQLEVLAEL